MNTVEKIVEICKDRKIAISRLEKACGFSNGYIRGLKRGDMPSNKLAKVADFLGVSTEYLSGEEEPVYYLNPETAKLLWVLFDCLAQKRIQRHTMARNAVFMPLGIRCPVAYTGIGAHTKA